MTVSITISGDTGAQLHEEALKVAAFFAPPAPLVPAADPKPAKGKKLAAQTDIEDVTGKVEHTSSASVAAAEVSHDDMVAELGKVNGKSGMQAVRDIIGKVGAKKVGEVKPEDRAAVMAAAKAALV